MRRLAPCLVIPLLLALAPSARAQQAGGEIVLRLVHQTPWNDPDHTSLGLVVRAVNDSDRDLGDLSLGIIIESSIGSRTEYEQSLHADTGEIVSAIAPPFKGDLPAGKSRRFRVPPVDLSG